MVSVVNRSWEVITGQVSWCFAPEVLPGVSWAFTDGWGQVWRRSGFGMYTRRSWHICSAAKHRSTLAGQNVDCMEGRPHTCTAAHTHTRTCTSGVMAVQREQRPLLLALFIGAQIQRTDAFRTEKLRIKIQWRTWRTKIHLDIFWAFNDLPFCEKYYKQWARKRQKWWKLHDLRFLIKSDAKISKGQEKVGATTEHKITINPLCKGKFLTG